MATPRKWSGLRVALIAVPTAPDSALPDKLPFPGAGAPRPHHCCGNKPNDKYT